MYVYEEIRDELKKNRYVIYKVEKKKFELAFKFNGKKSELKEKITKKYLRNLIKECMDDMGYQTVSNMQNVDPDGYEGKMAKSNLFKAAESAMLLHDLLQDNENLEPWVEGPWCHVGDLVRTIKYGGDRFVVQPDDDGSPVVFITIQAREVISKIKSFEAAQKMKAFVD